jgi:hypothetical protein
MFPLRHRGQEAPHDSRTREVKRMQRLPDYQPEIDRQLRWQPVEPPRPRYRRHFRWNLVWAALAVVVVVWFLNGTHVAFEWEDVMRAVGVPRHGYDRYSRLAALGIALVCVVAVYRLVRRRR